MALTKLSSALLTNYSGQSYSEMPQYNDLDLYSDAWQVDVKDTEGSTGDKEYHWQNTQWTTWHGYYRAIPDLAAVIDKKALWVTNDFEIKGSDEIKARWENIKGFGKETLTTIFNNLVTTYTIAGDVFAEIIRDKKGRIINLMVKNPGTMKIVTNDRGYLLRYEQTANLGGIQVTKVFDPKDILHLPWNKVADECHGISTIEKLKEIIDMLIEARRDLRVVFHRYVKPLMITEIDSDSDAKLEEFKAKFNLAWKKGENMFIPKGVVSTERFSIPQFSTLDPIPWIKLLQRQFLMAEGIPSIILGNSADEDTEASSKVVYLAFEQVVKYNQRFLEEQLKNQLNMDIKFKFDASLLSDLKGDEKKDGPMNSQSKMNAGKQP